MAIVKATIYFEKRFWVGTFERTDKEGYSIARHIFGGEPSDPEIYEFVLNHYHELKFGAAKEIQIQIHRMNPKNLNFVFFELWTALKPRESKITNGLILENIDPFVIYRFARAFPLVKSSKKNKIQV